MKEIIFSIFLVSGSFFIFVAAMGILKLPDLYTRMHATAKASSLGIGLLAMTAGFYFFEFWVFIKTILIIILIFLTAPVSAHMIARAGYLLKIRLWEGTVFDELKNQYDLKNGILLSKNKKSRQKP
jgi:multicomponent Na+:H+ antiporter subunit G